MMKRVITSLVIGASMWSSVASAAFWGDEPCGEVKSCYPIALSVDEYLSPWVGANIMLSITHAYMFLDDTFLPDSEGCCEPYMMLGRTAKFLVEDVLFGLETVAQHEYFGHGFRAREFNIPGIKYGIGPTSGMTAISLVRFIQLTPSERIAFIAGGVEADNIMAKRIRDRWLSTGCIDEREANMYLVSSLDETLYVLRTSDDEKKVFDGHDIVKYINQVNFWFREEVLTIDKLKKQILFNFIDPYFYYSCFSVINYIANGAMRWDYPMIPLCWDYCYLPLFRIYLAPYAPEYQFVNLFKGPEHIIQATLRYSNLGGKHSSGLGIEITKIWCANCMTIDGKFDIWQQPRLFTQTAATANSRFGSAISLIARYRFAPRFEVMGQLGYKTTGYLPGELLRRTPIAKAGILFDL